MTNTSQSASASASASHGVQIRPEHVSGLAVALVTTLSLLLSQQHTGSSMRVLQAELNTSLPVRLVPSEIMTEPQPQSPQKENDVLPKHLPRPTYADLKDEILAWPSRADTFVPRPNQASAYSRATVVRDDTSWFQPQRKCQDTCCVERVAISLDQDLHKIITGKDGRDVADLVMEYSRFGQGYHHKYHATCMTLELLPCLQPGSILFVQNMPKSVAYFWHTLRPHIRVPYVLVVSGADGDTPGNAPFEKDPLLLKLYGTNPNHNNQRERQSTSKFQGWNLGLGVQHPQEKHILPYLELTNYTNPFQNLQRFNMTQRPFDFDKDVFVHFGLSGRPHRIQLWKILCGISTTQGSSCNSDTSYRPVHEIYTDMSQYRFGISPPGFGWDCYRTYELLLMGLIPVIQERPDGRALFEGLPVVHMPRMNRATTRQDFVDAIQRFLESGVLETMNTFEGWKRLFLQHRRRQLLQVAGREKDIVVDPETGREYYQAFRYSVNNPGPNYQKDYFCSDEGSCELKGAADTSWLQA